MFGVSRVTKDVTELRDPISDTMSPWHSPKLHYFDPSWTCCTGCCITKAYKFTTSKWWRWGLSVLIQRQRA